MWWPSLVTQPSTRRPIRGLIRRLNLFAVAVRIVSANRATARAKATIAIANRAAATVAIRQLVIAVKKNSNFSVNKYLRF